MFYIIHVTCFYKSVKKTKAFTSNNRRFHFDKLLSTLIAFTKNTSPATT